MTTTLDTSTGNRLPLSAEHPAAPLGSAQSRATAPNRAVAAVGRRRSPMVRFWSVLALVAVLAVGCSSGPGSRDDFIEVLTRDGSLTDDEGTCITDAVFDEYEADSDALGKISAAPDFAYLSSEEGVPGFTEFFEDAVARCSTVGPTSG